MVKLFVKNGVKTSEAGSRTIIRNEIKNVSYINFCCWKTILENLFSYYSSSNLLSDWSTNDDPKMLEKQLRKICRGA